MTHKYSPKRSTLLVVLVLLVAILSTACAPAAPAPAPAETGTGDEAATGLPHDGVTLRVLTQAGTAYEPALSDWADEFSEQTGATVEFEFAPWETLMPKVQADLASGRPQFDIFCNDIEFQYTIWPELEPLNDYIEASDYDMEGFFDPVYIYGEKVSGEEGVRYGLPVVSDVSLVFYRTDLIDELPTTWDEYTALLEEHTTDDMYGLSFAGVTAQLVKLFLARYWSQGEPLLTPDWQPLINSDAGVEALTMLQQHAEQYAPPGVLAWDNPDAANAFVAGDVAIYEGWGGFILPNLDDPEKSNVVGNWAIGPYPEGGTGNFVQHNCVIFRSSENKQAAFDLIAYFTSEEKAKEGALEYNMTPARKSVFSDEDVIAAKPYFPDYATVLDRGKPFAPGVPQWLEMFIALGEGASQALSGDVSSQEALDGVAQRWVEILEQNPLEFEYTE